MRIKTKTPINGIILLFLLIFTVAITGQEQLNTPGHYDKTKKQYVLHESFFKDAKSYSLFKTYLNEAFFDNRKEYFEKLLDYDFKNYQILLDIADHLSHANIYRDPHDNEIFEDWLSDAVGQEKYALPLMDYYFRSFLILDQKLVDEFENGPYAPYPMFLFEKQSMLVLLRHLITKHSDYIHKTKYAGNGKNGHNFSDFLGYYHDASFSEIFEGFESYAREEETINIRNINLKIQSSTVLSNKYQNSNLLDYSLNTAWVEGSEGDGTGEWIEIQLDKKFMVDNLILFPGYGKSEKLFGANNRLKQAKVEWNGQSKIVAFEDLFCAQEVPIKDITDKIRITVLEVYKGSKYNDLCISEIMLTKPFSDH